MELVMTSKVRIKAGSIEIEFEGSEEYMKEELPSLVELLYSLSPAYASTDEEPSIELQASTDTSKQKIQMTTNTIAAKLNVKKDGELLLAACAHLALVKGIDTYTRANVLAEMRLATSYFKSTMTKNLSSTFKALVKQGKILETATDTYALHANTRASIEAALNAS